MVIQGHRSWQGFIQPPRRGGELPPETKLFPPGEGPSTLLTTADTSTAC